MEAICRFWTPWLLGQAANETRYFISYISDCIIFKVYSLVNIP